MKHLIFTLLMAFPLIAGANISTTTTVGSVSATTTAGMDPNFAALQADVNRLRLENAQIEKENEALEAEIKKLKRGKNLLIGTTIAGAAGTTIGGILWAKHKKDKKAAEATLSMIQAIETYQKENPTKFASFPDCAKLNDKSSEADLKKCYDKIQ